MLLVLPLAACQAAAERPTAILAMNATEMFPDPQVRALATAAARGDLERVTRLVQQGLDVDSFGVYGITPLFWAMQRQSKSGFTRLLELGADPNHHWTIGESVMSWAARAPDNYYLQQSLMHGGDANLVNPSDGKTPIISAASWGESHSENVSMLISAGADVNHRDNSGFTPMIWAASTNRHDFLYQILKAGGDPSMEISNSNRTVVYYINRGKGREVGIPGMSEWREKVIKLLRERGYDVE